MRTITNTRRSRPLLVTAATLAASLALSACATNPYDDYYDDYGYGEPYGEPGYNPDQPYYGDAMQPRKVSGELRPEDFPRQGAAERDGRAVTFALYVNAYGRVDRCDVTESSGIPELDRYTCDLIRDRFTYEPARDQSGRPVAGVAGWRQVWYRGGRR